MKSLSIGYDWQSTKGNKTGLGEYTKNLIEMLKKVAPENEYVLYEDKARDDLNTPRRWWWDQVAIPKKISRSGLDIFHKTAFSPPIISSLPVLYTVADFIGVLYPENFSFTGKLYWQKWLPYAAKRASMLIAISECTRNDTARILNIPKEKIQVVYIGCDKRYKLIQSRQNDEHIRKKYQLPGKFILDVTTLEPRKNITRLIDAFEIIKRQHEEYQLVIIGKKGWGYDEIFQKIRKMRLEKEIIFTGYVEDCDLPYIYNMATAFVFPSLYEGFGLPVLEAMSCGVPVVTSETSSLPEVTGNAAILVNPASHTDIARGICDVLSDKNRQSLMREQGLKQAAGFSWEKCARETLLVYEKLLSQSS